MMCTEHATRGRQFRGRWNGEGGRSPGGGKARGALVLLLAMLPVITVPVAARGASTLTLDGAGVRVTIEAGAELCAGEKVLLSGAEMSGDGTWCGGPTAVELLYLRAVACAGGVRVEWATACELETAGFHVWRGEEPASGYVRLTPEIVPARGSATEGAAYTFEDGAVGAKVGAWYKLEEIARTGSSTYHGPASAGVEPASGWTPAAVPEAEASSLRSGEAVGAGSCAHGWVMTLSLLLPVFFVVFLRRSVSREEAERPDDQPLQWRKKMIRKLSVALAVLAVVLVCSGVSAQDITGTLGEDGVFSVEDASGNALYRVRENGNVIGGYWGNDITNTVGTPTMSTIAGGGAPDACYLTYDCRNYVYHSLGTIGGGVANVAGTNGVDPMSGDNNGATVCGGFGNTASGGGATISGGAYNVASGSGAVISGGRNNTASDGSAAVAGGDNNTSSGSYAFVGAGNANTAEGEGAVVGGGESNRASGEQAFVGAGRDNVAEGQYSVVCGGGGPAEDSENNRATGPYASVLGGQNNVASGWYSSVGGGTNNVSSGSQAVVPGGSDNTADGSYSFAAGYRANANQEGCFVWADSAGADVTCDTQDRWVARASGGVYFYTDSGSTTGAYLAAGASSWNTVSDRATKENFRSVDKRAVLERLVAMPLAEYNLKSQNDAVRHIGPVAQDFSAAFGYGESDLAINAADADGIALAAIQGLHAVVQEKDQGLQALAGQVRTQRETLEVQRLEIDALREEVRALREHNRALEAQVEEVSRMKQEIGRMQERLGLSARSGL